MPKSPTKSAAAAPEADVVTRFEQSLGELEQLVGKMEDGELSLDESLRSFERGIALYRDCQAALQQAEARVKLLLDPAQPDLAQPFNATDET
jgi:exodeoxyribonuclease VII small subunit